MDTAIAIFAFNRPRHLKRMLESLELNSQITKLDVHIFVDGARHEADDIAVNQTVAVAESWQGGKTKKVVVSPRNKGLAKSLREGVSQVLREFDSIIVIEDDLILNPDFLDFMISGLRAFQSDRRVVSVQGYGYPIDLTSSSPYFLRGAGSWGWATWRDRWEAANWDAQSILHKLKSEKLIRQLDFGGTYFYSQMLRKQIGGKIDSWAVPFYCDAFSKGLLSLYPAVSLVENGGMDGSGTHEGSDLASTYSVRTGTNELVLQDIEIVESSEAREMLTKFFRSTFGLRARWRRIIHRIWDSRKI